MSDQLHCRDCGSVLVNNKCQNQNCPAKKWPGMDATTLQESEILGYAKDGKSGVIGLKNEDGAEFGSVLGPKEAVDLLSKALDLAGNLPPHIPDPSRGDTAHFVNFEADQIEIQSGAAPDKLRLLISSGGVRLAVQIDLDLFLSVVGDLIKRIEPIPGVPNQLQ